MWLKKEKKGKLINLGRLPTSLLLYIMMYIMLAYIMLLTALSNAVCLQKAYFLPLIFENASCFHDLSWFIDT